MTAPNRVDELRKRYHENPRRFFAPLANEYRKTGFLDRAILLCEKHLGEQPGNMNGLVVYGQCLFESGRPDEARVPFEGALAVDPENLIALRHLGDIARLGGDQAGARSWYEKVLELDRRNEEVLELIEEVGGREVKEPIAGPSSAINIFSVAPSVSVTEEPSFGMVDIASAAAPAPTAPPIPVTGRVSRSATPVDTAAKTVEVSARARPARRGSLLDVAFDFGEPVVAPPTPAPVGRAEPAAVPEEVSFAPLVEQPPEPVSMSALAPIEGLEAAEFTAEVEPLVDLEPMEFHGEEIPALPDLASTESDLTGRMEGLESTEFDPPPFDPGPAAPELLAPLSVAPRRAPALEEAETIELDADSLRALMETPSTPATFVTETMAELYVQQGFKERAADVYRQLIAQSPNDDGLRRRLDALEAPVRSSLGFDTPIEVSALVEPPPPANAMLSEVSFAEVSLSTPGESGRHSLPTPVVAPPVAPALESIVPSPEPVDSGPSAREYFGGFARRSLTPRSTARTGGQPSGGTPLGTPLDALFGAAVANDDERAAHLLAAVGATSGPSGGTALDSIFGEGPSAPMPVETTTLATPRAGIPRASDKLRFDQFFSTPDASAVVEAPAVPEEASAPATGAGEDPPAEDDDLDQFQGWLRGLAQ